MEIYLSVDIISNILHKWLRLYQYCYWILNGSVMIRTHVFLRKPDP